MSFPEGFFGDFKEIWGYLGKLQNILGVPEGIFWALRMWPSQVAPGQPRLLPQGPAFPEEADLGTGKGLGGFGGDLEDFGRDYGGF